MSGPSLLSMSRLEAIYAPAPTASASTAASATHTHTTPTTPMPTPAHTPLRDAVPSSAVVDGRDRDGDGERPLMVVTPEPQLRHPSHKTQGSIATKRKLDVMSTTTAAAAAAIAGASSNAVDSSKGRKKALQALLLQLDAELGVSHACAALEKAVETDLRDGAGMGSLQGGHDKGGFGGVCVCGFDGYYDDPGPTLVTVAVDEPVPAPAPAVDVMAVAVPPQGSKGKGKGVKPAKGPKASSLHDMVYTALLVSVFEGLRACLDGAITCLNEERVEGATPVVTIITAAATAAAAAVAPSSSSSSSSSPSPVLQPPPMWLLDAVGLPFSSFDDLRDSLSAMLCPINLDMGRYDPEWDSLSHFTVVAHVACSLLGPYRNKTLINRLASRIVDPPGMKACPGGEAKPITRRRHAAFVAVGTAFLGDGEGNKLLAVKKRPKAVHTHPGYLGDGDGTSTGTGDGGWGDGVVTVCDGQMKEQSWGHVPRPPAPLTLPFVSPAATAYGHRGGGGACDGDGDGGGDDWREMVCISPIYTLRPDPSAQAAAGAAPSVVRPWADADVEVEVVEVTPGRWGAGALG